MSSHEKFNTQVNEETVIAESLYDNQGNINEDLLRQRFGLGIEEANQPVVFGSYQGTVGQMLDDARCPVGAMASQAYEKDGLQGLDAMFNNLAMVDKHFSVEITSATREREEQVKKK